MPEQQQHHFLAIKVSRFRGTAEKMTGEQAITGVLELIPLEDGKSLLMLPTAVTDEENRFRHRRGLYAITPLGNTDKRLRQILQLSKNETDKAIAAEPGTILSIHRKGWGQLFTHTIQKLPPIITAENVSEPVSCQQRPDK